jgi:tripartite-type tricarboxylate transporter receptor subunit TctC
MKRWLELVVCMTIAVGAQAQAQNRKVTLVVPYPPGGAADQMARVISQEMRDKHGYTMIVDNRPGAGAQVAMNAVNNANPAAGTTLLLADSAAYSLNRHLYPHLNYNVKTDLLPLTLAARAPVFLLVNKDSPVRNIDDLVKLGQTKRLTYGSPGVGSGTHLVAEMLRKATGANLEHVPYRGAGPALIDAVSGQIDFIFDVLIGSREYVENGRLRLIAAASRQRSPLRPNVPTIAESGIPNVDVTIWWGISARAGTEPALARQLAADLASVLKDPAIVKRFEGFGIEMLPSTPEEFARLIEDDAQTYGPIIKSLNISLN